MACNGSKCGSKCMVSFSTSLLSYVITAVTAIRLLPSLNLRLLIPNAKHVCSALESACNEHHHVATPFNKAPTNQEIDQENGHDGAVGVEGK